MEGNKKPNIIFRVLDGIEAALSPIILLIIFIDVVLQVVSRMLPGNAVSWTVELGEILLGALIWLSIGIGVSKNSHIGFDLLVRRFSPKWRKILGLWNLNLFIFYMVLLSIFTIQLLGFYQKLSAKSTILQIGMFWVRIPILIGCILAVIRLVIKEIRVIRNKEEMYTTSSDSLE
jgi:TRAP-type C4-dicarboxylate transport system permease small subunit